MTAGAAAAARPRAAVVRAAILGVCSGLWLAGLGGCAALRSLTSDGDAAAPPASSTAAPGAPGARVAGDAEGEARYTLGIEAPDALLPLLSQQLDLARFQQGAPGSGNLNRYELDRLIAAAPAQARALLETQGYFEAQVQARRDEAALPHVTVTVDPGPRVRVASVAVAAEGPVDTARAQGDGAAASLIESLGAEWPLRAGQPFTQAAWVDAKNATLARLRAQGYPLGDWAETSADVDVESGSVRLSLRAASGPLFHMGPIEVRGLERYGTDTVENLRRFPLGAVYSETALADFQERLLKSGLFESASVAVEPDAAQADAAVVLVRVREQPLQQATLGVGVSANTGPRTTLEHTHRKPFGWAATAKNKFELGRDLQSWEGELLSHPLEGEHRNLIAASASKLDAAEEIVTSWRLRLGRTRDAEHIERLYYLEWLGATSRSAAGKTSGEAVSLNHEWVVRHLDSVLLPTRGYTASAGVGAGYAFGTTERNGVFGRSQARLTGYRPFGDDWYAQARVEAGEVFARADTGVPETLLFRAGGDDSVRGYAYRTLGPVVNGVVTSGRVLFTGSVEVARPVSPRLPSVWWAAFVDAGNAAERWKDLHPALGYGLGVRWRSPVGPLRVDLAYGQDVHKVRLHFSVGIAL